MVGVNKESQFYLPLTCLICKWISLISYALPAWAAFLSAGQYGRINVFLKHACKTGFCFNLITVEQLFCSSATTLCNRMQNQSRCLHITGTTTFYTKCQKRPKQWFYDSIICSDTVLI